MAVQVDSSSSAAKPSLLSEAHRGGDGGEVCFSLIQIPPVNDHGQTLTRNTEIVSRCHSVPHNTFLALR